MTEPYRDTSVSVERSKSEITAALREGGASGVQFEELWGDEPTILVRFIWHSMTVRFKAQPLPAIKGPRGGWKIAPEQRERQAWRGLAWYLESLVKAATFGIVPFEAVFLAYFEDAHGKTIGEHVIPMLEEGKLARPAIGGTS